MSDEFDVAVHDSEALAEIELLTNLIIATSEHEGRLPDNRIDEILGVAPPAHGPQPSPAGHEASTRTLGDPAH